MKKIIALFLTSFAFVYSVYATHLRAGQITVKQQPGSLTCEITVTVFTNYTNTNVLFGGEQDYLTFGDGTSVLVPETQNTYGPELRPGVGMASFTTFHTFKSYGSYLIGYREANRNAGILNMSGSVNTQFYIESFITLAENGPAYETPVLLMSEPVLASAVHTDYAESIACMDVNNYQLYYELVTPQSERNTDVLNYIVPENFAVDAVSGLLTWDTKFRGEYLTGEYAFAVRIYQIKDNVIVGYMLRDFQLIISESSVEGVVLDGGAQSNKKVLVPEGATARFRVAASAAETDDIALQVKSELEKFPESFLYTVEDSTHEAMQYKVAKITVINTAEIIRDTPYIISVRAVFGERYSDRIAKDLTYVIATREIKPDQPRPPLPEIVNEDPFGISVSPNPVWDFLKIRNIDNATINVRILDRSGKLWQQQTIKSSAALDLRSLVAGLYVCVLETAGKVTSYKIVKE
jgi:hypothetical protein